MIFSDASSHGLRKALLQDSQPVAYSSRSLTDAETRYAQIEKKMLLIVHAYTKFHYYIYRKPSITICNNHKPLEAIYKKPLLATPMCIQRMRLWLQWYDLSVKYRKGSDMELPDTPSRPQLPTSRPKIDDLETVSMPSFVAINDQKYADVQRRTKEELDPLMTIIKEGYPETKQEAPIMVQSYWDSRSQLVMSNGIIYKGLRKLCHQPYARICLV